MHLTAAGQSVVSNATGAIVVSACRDFDLGVVVIVDRVRAERRPRGAPQCTATRDCVSSITSDARVRSATPVLEPGGCISRHGPKLARSARVGRLKVRQSRNSGSRGP